MSVTAKRWVLKNAFVGYPKRDDFEIVEETLPALKDGGKPCMRMLDHELHHARRRPIYHRLQALICFIFSRARISCRGTMGNSGSLHEVTISCISLKNMIIG